MMTYEDREHSLGGGLLAPRRRGLVGRAWLGGGRRAGGAGGVFKETMFCSFLWSRSSLTLGSTARFVGRTTWRGKAVVRRDRLCTASLAGLFFFEPVAATLRPVSCQYLETFGRIS